MIGLIKKLWSMARSTSAGNPSIGHSILMGRPAAGIDVNENTALAYAAVWACVRAISETLATLAWHVYEMDAEGNRRIAAEDPVDRLLHLQPNPETTRVTFVETLTAHLLTWGNAYAEIERDRRGVPLALWVITPDRVRVLRDPDSRELVYEVREDSGETTFLRAGDVFHLKGLGYDGTVGYSPIRMHRDSISLGLASQDFGATFFGNGLQASGVVTHPGILSDDARANLKKSMREYRAGGPNRMGFLLFEEGIEYKQLTIPPEDAQFLETRKFEVIEIARIYRIPPHKIGDLERATFSNIEAQNIQFATDTIAPWAVRWEAEANLKLLADPRRFTKMNLMAMARGDSGARANFYQTMRDLGAFSVNDILRLEDMNTIGAIGDVRLVPMNMHTLEQAAGGTKEDGAADGAAQAASSASTGEAADVQRTALNGAQVTSLLQVAEFVSQSVLSKEAAKGVINVSFPATGEAQINRIVDNIEPMQTRETNAQADNSSADGANDSESDDGDAGAVHGPWVLDAAARVLHREANAVARAAKSTSGDYRAFDERVSRFFAEDRRTIVEAFAPLFAALGCPTARLSVIATDHAEQRRTEALDAFRCGSVADLCERWQSIEPALTAGIVLMNAEAALDKKELCHAS